jgi:surface carbohydrate biosynthesis protein (TIGR04326 family)
MGGATAGRVVVFYDAPPDSRAVARLAQAGAPVVLELFPLTSSWNATAAWMAAAQGVPGIAAVDLADSPRALDDEARRMRTTLAEWVTRVGNTELAGVTLRRRLLVAGAPVSGWWFTPLAERNPLVSRFIVRLAQVRIVERRLTGSIDRVAIALGTPALRVAVRTLAHAQGRVPRDVLPIRWRDTAIERASRAAEPVKALIEAGRIAMRAVAARRRLGPYRPPADGATLFVTYFPAFDRTAAARGEFADRYLGAVRDLTRGRGEPDAWLTLPQPIDGATFGDALRLAASFPRERIAAWYQLLTPAAVWRGIGRWRRHAAVYRRFREDIERAAAGAFGSPAASPVIAGALRKGFLGARALQAFLLHEAFDRALEPPARVARVIYCAEFQPWEAALCAAAAARGIPAIGFQHTTIPPNLYNYQRDRREFDAPPAEGGMPLPRVVAANGDRPAALLAALGLPGVRQVEAVRHAAVRDLPPRRTAGPRTSIVLIGSIDPAETAAMLELAAAARPLLPEPQYVFRPHPLGRRDAVQGWTCTSEPVADLLRSAAAAIVPSSSVAVEALATGCPIVQPIFADAIATGPLDDREGWHVAVSTPVQLAEALRRAMAEPPPAAEALVDAMWCRVTPGLPRWAAALDGA